MRKKLLLPLTIASLLASSTLLADENIDADLDGFGTEIADSEVGDELSGFGEETSDELDGFGDEELAVDTAAEAQEEPSNFTLSGNVAFKTALGYKEHEVGGIDYQGVNQAQTSLYLQVDGKLSDNWKVRISGDAYYDAIYDINSDNEYSDDILDAYKTQLRLDDTYIAGRLTNDIDLKVGRQLVVWGKSDSIRITDVINPIDNRLPGMTDIEDLRLSVGMAKLDYYLGSWNLSGMVIGESRIMLEAPARSEFFPVDSIFLKPDGSSAAPEPFPSLETPESSWSNLQYAVAANGVFSGWDLSFYGANVLDQKWHFEDMKVSLDERVVSKVKMLGSAINIATGSWLLKSEIAYLDGVRYNNTTDDKSRLDALVGLDYMGVKDTVFSLEVANRHIFDYEDIMKDQADFVDEDEMQTAIRITRSFSNDTINTGALLSMFGSSWQNGGFGRLWVEYDVIDAVVANFGLVDYIGGDKPLMDANQNNDRVFADITYSF